MPGKRSSRARPRCSSWPTTRSSSGTCTDRSRTGTRAPSTPTASPAPRRWAHIPRPAPHAVPRATPRHRGHRDPAWPLGRRAYPPVRRRADHHRGEPLGGTARAGRVPAGIPGDQPGHHRPQDAEREIRALNAALEQRVRSAPCTWSGPTSTWPPSPTRPPTTCAPRCAGSAGSPKSWSRSTATGSTTQAAGTPGVSRRPASRWPPCSMPS